MDKLVPNNKYNNADSLVSNASANKRTLTEQLKSHFNLRGNPFSSKNACFFDGAQRKHNLETIRHMAIFGDMVLLLTGELGSGKTSLIECFVQSQDDELNILIQSKVALNSGKKIAAENVQAKKSVDYFASLANLQVVDGEPVQLTLSRLVQKFEQAFKETGKRTLMIVDDADLLSKDELSLYFSVFRDLPVESGLVLLLSGAPKLLDIARTGSNLGAEDWLHQIQLKPFSPTETVEYLQCCLASVGYQERLSLSETQLENLAKIGKGLPGRINRFFAYVVFELGLPEIDKPNVNNAARKVLFSITALLLLSFLFVSYQHGLLDFSALNASSYEENPVEEVAEELDIERLIEKQRAARLKVLERAIEVSGSKTGEGDDVSKITVAEINEQPKKVKQTPEAVLQSINNSTALTKKIAIVEVVKKEPAVKQVPVIKKELPVKKAQKNLLAKKELLEEKSNKKPTMFRTREWVVAIASSHYSAQLLGSYNESTAIEFIEKAGLVDTPLYYLKTLYKGRDWYVVFYGDFASKKIAQAAILAAPKVVRKQGPWLRSFSGILSSYPE